MILIKEFEFDAAHNLINYHGKCERLKLPHVDMCNRFFVLEPLCETASNSIHPVLKKTTSQLLDVLKHKEH